MRVVFVNGELGVDTRLAEDNVAENSSAVGGCHTSGYEG